MVAKIKLPNYLDSLSWSIGNDRKPICMHGTGQILVEMHAVLRRFLKGGFVKFIEEQLNCSSRAYYYWLQNKKPIPITKAKNLVDLWHNLTNAGESSNIEMWDRFYRECSGFSVDGGNFIMLPKAATPDFAYFIGALFGDGCIYSHTVKGSHKKTRYGIQITDESRDHLVNLVSKIKSVFKIESVTLRKGDGNYYNLIINSKVIHTFLRNVISMPVGKKKGKLTVPKFIENDRDLAVAFLRGLFDADGGMSRAPKPSLILSQSDPRFLEKIQRILGGLGISIGGVYTSGARKGNELRSFRRETINKFNKIIGFEHPLKKQNQHLTNVTPT
jgi:hypothetical protein